MAGYNLKSPEEVEEYLKNLHIEYKFGCYSEKKPEVCHLLGDYEESITQDFTKAAKVYKINCDDNEYGKSCSKFGTYTLFGKGCDKDITQAYNYMKKGCDLNDGNGCYSAGAVALAQRDLEKDDTAQIKNAMTMLQKACQSDVEKACFHLAGVYFNGIEGSVEKNYKEAYKLSLKSCEFGNPYACANVSLMHKKGDGVQQNPEMAEAFKKRALTLMSEIKQYKKQLDFQRGIKQ